jgi:hypothetical protein
MYQYSQWQATTRYQTFPDDNYIITCTTRRIKVIPPRFACDIILPGSTVRTTSKVRVPHPWPSLARLGLVFTDMRFRLAQGCAARLQRAITEHDLPRNRLLHAVIPKGYYARAISAATRFAWSIWAAGWVDSESDTTNKQVM